MDKKCPFCGSDKIRVDTPYMDPITHKKLQSFCCRSQSRNHDYIEKHRNPITGEKPDAEEAAKW